MDNKCQDSKKLKNFYMIVPPGTPLSIMANAVEKFYLTMDELEIPVPLTDDELVRPKTLILKGSKKNLLNAKKFIKRELEVRIEKYSLVDSKHTCARATKNLG